MLPQTSTRQLRRLGPGQLGTADVMFRELCRVKIILKISINSVCLQKKLYIILLFVIWYSYCFIFILFLGQFLNVKASNIKT